MAISGLLRRSDVLHVIEVQIRWLNVASSPSDTTPAPICVALRLKLGTCRNGRVAASLCCLYCSAVSFAFTLSRRPLWRCLSAQSEQRVWPSRLVWRIRRRGRVICAPHVLALDAVRPSDCACCCALSWLCGLLLCLVQQSLSGVARLILN